MMQPMANCCPKSIVKKIESVWFSYHSNQYNKASPQSTNNISFFIAQTKVACALIRLPLSSPICLPFAKGFFLLSSVPLMPVKKVLYSSVLNLELHYFKSLLYVIHWTGMNHHAICVVCVHPLESDQSSTGLPLLRSTLTSCSINKTHIPVSSFYHMQEFVNRKHLSGCVAQNRLPVPNCVPDMIKDTRRSRDKTMSLRQLSERYNRFFL